MTMNHQEIAWTLDEWALAAEGGRVQKVLDDSDQTALILLRTPAHSFSILASIDPRRCRLHAQTSPKPPANWRRQLVADLSQSDTHKSQHTPKKIPLGFTEAARRWLLGKAFVSAVQAPGERFVRLSFDGPSVDPDVSGRCDVLCAITGPNANLWLLDANNRLIAALDPRRRSHFDLALAACASDSARPLASPPPAPEPDPQPDQEQNFLIRNKLIEAHERSETTRLNFESAKTWLGGVVRQALKKQTRLTAALQRDLDRASAATQDKIHGDLLAAHFHALRRGLSEITLENFFDDMRPITIPLDPARSPSENLDRFYKRYRKYSAASDHILGRLIDAETRTDKPSCRPSRAL